MPRVRLELLLHLAVAIGVVWAAATFLRLENLGAAFSRLSLAVVALVLALGVLYTVVRGLIFAFVTRSVSDVPSRLVLRAYLSAEATALLPGGVAARMALLYQLGVPMARGLVPVLVVSALDQVIFGLVVVIAAVALPSVGARALLALPLLVAFVAVLTVPRLRALLGRLLAPLLRRFGGTRHFELFEDALRGTVTSGVIVGALAFTLLAFSLKVGVLALCLAEVDAAPSFPMLVFAFVLPTLVGRLTPTPGGAGVTEAGMVAFLANFASVRAEDALVATLLFRVATTFLPAMLGGVLYGTVWRRTQPLERERT